MNPWWYYLVAIPAMAFLVNGVPHYVHGVSGKKFPTPFSGGAGTLDGAVRNVFWGAGNFIVGSALLWLIWPGVTDAPMIGELVVLAVVFSALLGWLMADPERKKGNKPPA
jgi:hypothetical protein